MAIKAFTPITNIPNQAVIEWTGLAASDTGSPMKFSTFADKTVQAFGTFGGTVTLEGSNDPRCETDAGNAVYAPLTDNLGNPIAFSSAGISLIAEAPVFIRPNCGSGVTSVTIIICSNSS